MRRLLISHSWTANNICPFHFDEFRSSDLHPGFFSISLFDDLLSLLVFQCNDCLFRMFPSVNDCRVHVKVS